MWFQLLGIALATTGWVKDKRLFVIGGFLCLAVDLFGLITGGLLPTFTIILYVAGFLLLRHWHGILVGSVFGNAIDLVGLYLHKILT
jgi:hypothetical protein